MLTALGVFGVIALAIALIQPRRVEDIGRLRVAWGNVHGVCVATAGDSRSRRIVYYFPTRSGKIIDRPAFAAWHSGMVYYSPTDRSICILSPDGCDRWISLSRWVHVTPEFGGDGTCRISDYANGLCLSVAESPTRICVLQINLAEAKVTRLPGLDQVRASGASNKIAVLDSSGGIGIRDALGGSTESIGAVRGARDPRFIHWDCDPANSAICYVSGYRVRIAHGVICRKVSLPWPYGARDVSVNSAAHQFWVSGDMEDLGSAIFAYSYDGTYLGKILNAELPIQSPVIVLSGAQAETLNKLPHAYGE